MGGTHTHTHAHRGRLRAALLVTLGALIVQVVGAVASGSLALLADSAHMLSDALGLALALGAATLAARPPTAGRTFGWRRLEILAALVNGLVVGAVGVTVAVEGVRRVMTPPDVDSGILLVAAGIGLVANVIALRLLAGGRSDSLNLRGAYLEVLGDLLGSVAVIAAGAVMWATGWMQADGVASILIGVLIVPRAVLLLRDVLKVLLEATPDDIDLTEVRDHLLSVPGVTGVHDLHAWTITSGMPVLTAHVEVDGAAVDVDLHTRLLGDLQACIAGHFDVTHSTFQLETPSHRDREATCEPR